MSGNMRNNKSVRIFKESAIAQHGCMLYHLLVKWLH